ncbi:MAG: glycine cleavage T C-terminal barrel domain-containing protein, partial [Vicinamibacterales bacterium]
VWAGHDEGGLMSCQDDYSILHSGAGIGRTAPRRPIGVTGRDRATYLHGLLTNDIQALTPGSGCYAAWLTPQGRMLTDLHVLESGDMILLDVPVEQHEATLARLEQFLFSEDVQLSDLGASLASVWIHGPAAAATIERLASPLVGLSSWPTYHNVRAEVAGAPAVIARIDQLGVPGFCLWLDAANATRVISELEPAGASRVSADAIEASRIDAAYPLFGIDMTSDTIPLEAGIEGSAISLTKGCYVGQEIIIRVLHRGHGRVARKLSSLRIEDGVPIGGARVFAGDREVGWVTSAARSPRNGPVALAYVHRDFLAPGTRLDVDIDGHRCVAQITAPDS